MNKKVKPFKQTVFLSEQCAICSLKSYSKCSKCSLSALGQARNRFATRLGLQCPVYNKLFEVSSEIRCSGVSSRYCCYGKHAAGSKPI